MEKPGQKMPNSEENRTQQTAERHFFQEASHQQGAGVHQPQVPLTDGKTQIEPAPKDRRHEKKVCDVRVLPAQRAQRAVQKTQGKTQHTSPAETLGIQQRRVHPNKRRQKDCWGRFSW